MCKKDYVVNLGGSGALDVPCGSRDGGSLSQVGGYYHFVSFNLTKALAHFDSLKPSTAL